MAQQRDSPEAWIFLSHASADLPRVRDVRNYLEAQGASPLLFHLRSLSRPEEFWPIIEREIEERNFFLFCSSPAANASVWVRRERALVRSIAKERHIRVGEIRVDVAAIDTRYLDAFLSTLRIFPSFARSEGEKVEPYLEALRQAGFYVADVMHKPMEEMQRAIRGELMFAAEAGWHLVFVGDADLSPWVHFEMGMSAAFEGRVVFALLGDWTLPALDLRKFHILDLRNDAMRAPHRLPELLMALPQ